MNIEIYYPVVVVQGKLLDVRTAKRGLRLRNTDHIRYCRTAILRGEAAEYQTDVVSEAYFPKYIKIIEEETSQIVTRMKRHRKAVRASIDKIVHKARRLRSHEKIRGAMDF